MDGDDSHVETVEVGTRSRTAPKGPLILARLVVSYLHKRKTVTQSVVGDIRYCERSCCDLLRVPVGSTTNWLRS